MTTHTATEQGRRTAVLTDTGGLSGGIAGFHHLYIRVQGSSD